MKIKVIKVDEINDILYQYWNQMEETISTKAKEYLEEQIDMNCIEIEIPEDNK